MDGQFVEGSNALELDDHLQALDSSTAEDFQTPKGPGSNEQCHPEPVSFHIESGTTGVSCEQEDSWK